MWSKAHSLTNPLVINPFDVINISTLHFIIIKCDMCMQITASEKSYPFWYDRNSPITVKSQLLMHSASHRKTTDTFLSNMEHIHNSKK